MVPREATLRGEGAAQRFLVLGRYEDGLDRDVTAQTSLVVVDEGVARAEGTGRVLAVSDGETQVRAELGGKVAKAELRVQKSRGKRPFSFVRDLEGIFTRRGCNGSSCHGSVKGRGGFKLSLNGLHPREDYLWVVRGGVYRVLSAVPGEPQVPRIDLEEPEQSLLLLKPTATVAHGGGLRFEVGSQDYRTLREWVRRGAPFDEDQDRLQLQSLEVAPGEVVVESEREHRLLVMGRMADRRT